MRDLKKNLTNPGQSVNKVRKRATTLPAWPVHSLTNCFIRSRQEKPAFIRHAGSSIRAGLLMAALQNLSNTAPP